MHHLLPSECPAADAERDQKQRSREKQAKKRVQRPKARRASHMRLTPKARDAEPHCFHGTTRAPASAGMATFSARSWHDGLKMTKDRNAVENRRFNRLKWLEKHERSAVDAHKRTITPRFAKFSQVAYYNETRFSPPTPMFRDFQAISASSARSFARQRKQEVEMPRVVGGRDPRICTQRDIAEGGRSPRRRTAVPKIAFCKPDKGKQGTARHEQASCKRV